jgi:hypothetical protein
MEVLALGFCIIGMCGSETRRDLGKPSSRLVSNKASLEKNSRYIMVKVSRLFVM